MRVLLLLLLAGSCRALSKIEQEVVDAIKQAQQNIQRKEKGLKTIKENGQTSQTQKANGDSQLEQLKGDLLGETTKILTDKYGVGGLSQFENVNLESLIAAANYGRRKRRYTDETTSGTCFLPSLNFTDCYSTIDTNLRSITGLCNNRANKNLGKAVTPIRRLLGKASYADGIGSIRANASNGAPLPSTREVSNRLHAEGATPFYDYWINHFHMQFGQFITHDIIFMPSSVGPSGETLDCSLCNSTRMSDNCAPITVPNTDTYFTYGNCITLTRSLNGQKGLGQRTQIDQNTHFLDLSAVYGSDECVAREVRSFSNGELRVFNNGFALPPQDLNDTNCKSTAPFFCFKAGDFRNSLHPGLIPLHTVFIKEHNRAAAAMRKIRSDWSDEQLYQEARRLMIARYQHHIYSEYLPKLLGQKIMDEFGLTPLQTGYFTGYSESVDPSLTAEFAAAAFRFGHSQVRKDFPRLGNSNQTVDSAVDLGANFFYADSLYKTSGTESMLDGMIQWPGMSVDRQFTFPIRNQLFETRGKPGSGVDLVAVNLMRGRDVGLFPYSQYRAKVGLPVAGSFDALLTQMSPANVAALKGVYTNVNDIDLYSGLLMEFPSDGAMIGRTGAYIIAETFSNLKKGDRFFYESKVAGSRSLTPEELTSIRGTSLSKLLCQVSPSIQLINVDVFDTQQNQFSSRRVPCSTLKDIDISPFVPKA